MFLAATALSEFWDKERELLFLGSWCRPYARRAEWEPLKGRVLPSPWSEPGAVDRGADAANALHEALLAHLAAFLNGAHGVRRSERYWRIVLGPWLLGYSAAIVDHGLHLDRALALDPALTTWALDPRDRRTPLDTADFASRLITDLFQLQLYSELLEARGVRVEPRRGPEPPAAASQGATLKSRAKGAAARVVRAFAGADRLCADFYASPRQTLALMRACAMSPLGVQVPTPRAVPDASRRAGLEKLSSSVPYAAEAAALLPRHLPTLFLEGHADFRRAALAGWPKLPRRLLTSVGWYSNETFKLLAAEATEAGAELIISQHGGAYGMMDPIFSERHERRIADRYFTWGWSDSRYPGAKTVPLPNPKLDAAASAPAARSGKWLLVTTSLARYPYVYYFANAPAAHRFEDALESRVRFLRAAGPDARAAARVRLHPSDLGWSHAERLSAEFPDLALDAKKGPWLERAGAFDLVVIDHPQTSMLECLGRDVPTLLFWEPALWRMRPEAAEVLDGLRRAGILLDSPEAAAAALPAILAAPAKWWARPEARAARAAFCARYARSSPDWLKEWAAALKAGAVPSF